MAVAIPSATGLHTESLPTHYIQVINGLYGKIQHLEAQVEVLTGKKGDKKKEVTELRAFSNVPMFGGDEKSFSDFELKL